MNCVKNPKKWFVFKYKGEHQFEPFHVKKFMDCSTDFIVTEKCKLCGARDTNHFIKWDEALNKGFTNEQLQMADNGQDVYITLK